MLLLRWVFEINFECIINEGLQDANSNTGLVCEGRVVKQITDTVKGFDSRIIKLEKHAHKHTIGGDKDMKIVNMRKYDNRNSKTKAFFDFEIDLGVVIKGFKLVEGSKFYL